MSAHRPAPGFGLFELMLALLAFGLLAAAGYTALDSLSAVSAHQRRAGEDLRELQLTLLHFERDVRQAVDRPYRDGAGRHPPLHGDSRGFTAIRTGQDNPGELRRSGLQRLRYRLHDGAVQRAAWHHPDAGAPAADTSRALLHGVAGLSLRYRSADGTWHGAWPPPGGGGLPVAVELTLRRDNGADYRRLVTTVALR